MNDAIRILCVDDHPIVQEGLALIIAREHDMSVVATADDGVTAIERYEQARPDVTLMDLQLPRMNGVEAIRGIRDLDHAARIIVLTMYGGDEDIHRALDAGASTYVLKDTVSDALVDTIRAVHAGEDVLPPDVQARLDLHAQDPHLTDRETDVLELVAVGHRNKDIASILGISNETVHVHLKNIFTKLGVTDRTAAVFVATQRGIIHFDPPPRNLWDRVRGHLRR